MEQIFHKLLDSYFYSNKSLKKKIIEKYELYNSYLQNILKWNKNINLTGFNKEEFIFSGIIEPLLIFKNFTTDNINLITDVGSGAGIPAITFAILFKDKKIYAVEVNKKRLSFLNFLKFNLSIDNLIITRVPPEYSDLIVSRAFMNINNFLDFLSANSIKFKYLLFYFKNFLKNDNNAINLISMTEYKHPFKSKSNKYYQVVFDNISI